MAEGSIPAFDFHVQHYGLSGRLVSWEGALIRGMGLGESDSWPKVIILLICQIYFPKYIWRFPFVLTNFFFFSGNTTHPEVSYRENDYVERVSIINVELSHVNKAVWVWNDIPGPIHPQPGRFLSSQWSESEQQRILQTRLQFPRVSTAPACQFPSLSSKPSVGFHFKLDLCHSNSNKC